MPAAAGADTFRYEVELEDGSRYEITVDREIPDTARVRALLRRLIALELAKQPSERFKNRPTLDGVLSQVGGGIVDVVQDTVDLPFDILNIVTAGISPDPPGPPGTRRRLIPEVEGPRLPNVTDPRNTPEQIARTGSGIATALAAALLAPPVRRGVGRLFGQAERPTPLMFEPGAAVSRPLNKFTPGVPTIAPPTTPNRLSDAAATFARRVFDLPSSVPQIRAMKPEQIQQAIRRIRTLVPDVDPEDFDDPVAELLRILEDEVTRRR